MATSHLRFSKKRYLKKILETTGLKDLSINGNETEEEQALKLYGKLLLTDPPTGNEIVPAERVSIPRTIYLSLEQRLEWSSCSSSI